MFRSETEKQAYTCKLSFHFHATDDVEADYRANMIHSLIQRLVSERGMDTASAWLYEDVDIPTGFLVSDGWPNGEDRVVR